VTRAACRQPVRCSGDGGGSQSVSVILLVPVMTALAFIGIQTATWSHARAEARVVARDGAALVARGSAQPGEAGRMIEESLSGSSALADVAVSVERTSAGVTVVVDAVAPGMLIGTGRDLRVVEFVPESGWVE
jgi:hypothetical protein